MKAAHHTIVLEPRNQASFNPANGVLQYLQSITVEFVRIPRSLRLRRQTFPAITSMSFMTSNRITVELRFREADYPELSTMLTVWWMVGAKGAGQ